MLYEKKFYNTAYGYLQVVLSQIGVVLDAVNSGVLTVDTEGRVSFLNQTAEKIIRRRRKDCIGKHLSEVVIPLGLLDVLKTGQMQLAYRFSVEYSQGKRDYIAHRTPIFKNGKIVSALTVFQDITENEIIYKELDDLVKLLNQEMETLIEASYDVILVTDRKGEIIRSNDGNGRLVKLVSHNRSALYQKIIMNVVPRVIEKSMPVSDIMEIETGRLVITANPVFKGLVVDRVVINIRDLTESNSLKQTLDEKLKNYFHQTGLSYRNKEYLMENGIVVYSKEMEQIMSLALRVADVDSNVLIFGESGTGKGIIANTIHKSSRRSEYPMIKVNCGAIPDNLLESELFGYSPAAFTGASKSGKAGLFELADKGTIFLDEVGDLPLHLQVKLLHAIQDKVIYRVGSVKPYKIDVRIIAATNHDLKEMVKKGHFREDLFFRLNVIPIYVPALRERREDIVPLIKNFQDKLNKRYNLNKTISQQAIELLVDYNWPGNVRELENMVEQLLVTTVGNIIMPEDLPLHFTQKKNSRISIYIKEILPLKTAIKELERQLIFSAIERCGSTYKAAKALNINQSTVIRKINKLKNN